MPRRLKPGQQQFVCLSFAFDRDGVPIDPDHARPAELIAQNIPNPASMCYDAGANQLVIPMNANNALAFIRLK